MVKINKVEPECYKVEIQGTSNVVANELSNGLFHFMKILDDMGADGDTITRVIEQITETAITKTAAYRTLGMRRFSSGITLTDEIQYVILTVTGTILQKKNEF